jgi:hypothetical protein
MNKNFPTFQAIKYLALAGNVLYILWILYNAFDSGFQERPVQAIALTGLMALLILNILLISRSNKNNNQPPL